MISSSCIACLAHLAVLYEVVCRTDPVAGEMYALCDSALRRLGVLTSELHLDECTYLDLLLAVRPSLYCSRLWLFKCEAGIGILEEIATSLRRPHRKPPLGGEWIITTLPPGHRRKVLRFPWQTSRSRAAAAVRFGDVRGRYDGRFEVSELDVTRGEGEVWDVTGTSGSECIAGHELIQRCSLCMPVGIIATTVCQPLGPHMHTWERNAVWWACGLVRVCMGFQVWGLRHVFKYTVGCRRVLLPAK